MITVESLIFDYPRTRALTGLDLSIATGTVTALVGPNGAGKTTLLRCLAALERPTIGRVQIDGIDTATNPRAVHARVGYLPDFFGLYDELTVEQCLMYAAAARATAARQVKDAAARAAARVGLAGRMQSRAGELSRGLRQRLAIGQAVVHEPRLALLDEPASGLDPEARRSLSDLIRQLAGEGTTVVVSSHILAELDEYCDQMVMMRAGAIAGAGPVARGNGAAMQVRARFIAPPPDLAAHLEQAPGVEGKVSEVSGERALFTVRDGDAAAAALLRALLDAGLEVAEFVPQRETLERAYLAEVSAQRKEVVA